MTLCLFDLTDQSAEAGGVPRASEQIPQRVPSLQGPQEPAGPLAAAQAVLPPGGPEWWVFSLELD